MMLTIQPESIKMHHENAMEKSLKFIGQKEIKNHGVFNTLCVTLLTKLIK